MMSPKEAMLTKEMLEHKFYYNIEKGTLRWKNPTSNRARKDVDAGWIDTEGYRKVTINNTTFRVHRILFYLANGRWPLEIDHLNGDKSDNRSCNIVESTRSENNRNRAIQSNNTSGVTGVRWVESKKAWRGEFTCKDFRTSKIFSDFSDCVEWRQGIMNTIGFGPNHGRTPCNT